MMKTATLMPTLALALAPANAYGDGSLDAIEGVSPAHKPPSDAITEDFFGTSLGAVLLDAAPPSSWIRGPVRLQNVVGRAPGYKPVFSWEYIEPMNDQFVWDSGPHNDFDAAAAAVYAQGFRDIIMTTSSTPKWAVVGNARQVAVTGITVGSPAVVTAPNNHYVGGGTKVFFNGTSTPAGISPNTSYCISGGNSYTEIGDSFSLMNCETRAAINTTGGSASADLTLQMERSNPTNQADLDDYVEKVVKRFKSHGLRVVMWGGWNEWLNGSADYYTDFTAADKGGHTNAFMRMLYKAVKGVDTSIAVSCPSVGTIDDLATPQYTVNWPPLQPHNPTCDVLDVHMYQSYSATWNSNDKIATRLDTALAFYRARGMSKKKLIISEIGNGYSAGTIPEIVEVNAINAAQTVLISASRGVSTVIPFLWSKAQRLGGGHVFGMCNYPCGAPNAYGIAYIQLQDWLLGAHSFSYSPTTSNMVEIVFTRRDGRKAMAVWRADATSGSYTVPPGYTHQTTIGGVKTVASGTVTVGFSPIMLTQD